MRFVEIFNFLREIIMSRIQMGVQNRDIVGGG